MLRLGARPVPSRSSGTYATPAAIAARGSPATHAASRDRHACRPSAGAGPAIVSASSRWPFPATPAIATISPARSDERDVLQRRLAAIAVGAEAARSRGSSRAAWRGFATRRALARARGRPSAPRASAASRPSIETVAIVRPPRSTVTRSATAFTSCSLCEMKITVRPISAIARSVVEEDVGLLRRQHGRRLVEDQDVARRGRAPSGSRRVAARRATAARCAHADRPASRSSSRRSRDAALDRATAETERAPLAAVVAEHDVLRDGERLDEPEVLVHHADARVERVARRVEVDAAAAQRRSRPRPAGRGP